MGTFIFCIFHHTHKTMATSESILENSFPREGCLQNPTPRHCCPKPPDPGSNGVRVLRSCGHCHLAGPGWRWSHPESRADTMPFVQGQCWLCSRRWASGFPCAAISVCSARSSLPSQVRASLRPGAPRDHLSCPARAGHSPTESYRQSRSSGLSHPSSGAFWPEGPQGLPLPH